MKYVAFSSIAIVALLSGCTQVTQALDTVQTACQKAGPTIQAVQALNPSPTSTVGVLSADLSGACTAEGNVAATLASNQDENSPSWINQVNAALATAAGIVQDVSPFLSLLGLG